MNSYRLIFTVTYFYPFFINLCFDCSLESSIDSFLQIIWECDLNQISSDFLFTVALNCYRIYCLFYWNVYIHAHIVTTDNIIWYYINIQSFVMCWITVYDNLHINFTLNAVKLDITWKIIVYTCNLFQK